MVGKAAAAPQTVISKNIKTQVTTTATTATTITTVKVYGLLPTVEFQKAKCCAEVSPTSQHSQNEILFNFFFKQKRIYLKVNQRFSSSLLLTACSNSTGPYGYIIQSW